MENFKNLLREFYIELVLALVLIISFILSLQGILPSQSIFYVLMLCSILVFIKYIFNRFLDFFITIRNKTTFWEDNRTVNYLTFDFFKFVLILLGLVTIIILGLNKILQNETIATLLGGLIGSLITIKSGYMDPRPLTREEEDRLNNRGGSN